MKYYNVSVAIVATGTHYAIVAADSAEEAIEKARKNIELIIDVMDWKFFGEDEVETVKGEPTGWAVVTDATTVMKIYGGADVE